MLLFKNKFSALLSLSSIKAKLIWILIVLGGLPPVVAGFLFYSSAADALLNQTQEQLGNVAEKTAQQIDSFFEVTRKEIILLSNFPFVQLAFLQFEFSQRLDTVKRLLEDYALKNNHFNNIYLINLEGNTILSLNESSIKTAAGFRDTEWFKKTLNNGIYLSNLEMTGTSRVKGIMLAKVVYDFEHLNQVVGVLAFDIKSSSFTHYVESLRIGSRGFGFLMHESGQLIYHPEKRLMTVDIRQLGDERMQGLVANMISGKSGYGNYRFENAEKYLLYRPCKIKSWSVGVTLFKSELMADIYKFRRRMITFFVIIIGLILPVSFLFIRSFTTPIQCLINGVAAIGNGDLDHVITIKSSDELQAVASEFNRMAATLKETMEEILELKTFNEDILRNIAAGVVTVDRTGNITSINNSAQIMLDYKTKPGLIEKSVSLPKPVRQVLTLLEKTLTTGDGSLDYELKISDQNDEVTYLEIHTSLLASELGKTFGAIADMRDITRRKRIEEIMVRVDKLASLGELSAGMAHEIRNPLAGIKTSVQVLANRIQTESGQELIDGIISEINRLNTIVSDLLRFARPSPPIVEPVELVDAIEKTLDLVSEKIRISRVTVSRQYQNNLVPVMADKEQIRQIILNLLLNGIKAMDGGGELVLIARSEPDETPIKEKLSRVNANGINNRSGFVELIIKDSGQGIQKENLSKVFNPFFTTNPSGTGLGLSIVHQLVEKNRGYIFIDSVEHEGTQVTLLLPVTNNNTGDQINAG